MLAVSGILVDAARIVAGEAQVKRAISSAARSLLADYSSELKNQYGIFAINQKTDKDLNATAKEYMENNLSIGIESLENINLFNFKIENISVTPMFNLTDNQTVKNQILEYMKYRAPKQLAQNLWQKISVVKESGKMAQAYDKRFDVDKLMRQMGELQQKLKINISGTIGDKNIQEYYINKFDSNGERTEAIREYARLILMINSEDGEKGLIKEKNSIERLLKRDLTNRYIDPNREAGEIISRIADMREMAEEGILEIEEYIEENFDSSSKQHQNLKEALEQDIAKLKDMIFSGEEADALHSSIIENSIYLQSALNRLSQVSQIGIEIIQQGMGEDGIIEFLTQGFGNYDNTIQYDYHKIEATSLFPDPRNNKPLEVGEALKGWGQEDVNIEHAGINIDELPSRKKYREVDEELNFEGSLETLWEEVDFNSNEGQFVGKAFKYIQDMGNLLSTDLKDCRDEIYINEYIMEMFKNSVPRLYGPGLKSFSKVNIKNTFFNSEVEYVLHGDSSERINRIKTQAQILLIRFAMNTIHAYSDGDKREIAKGIAAAVAGWWTAGAGIPIISNLIMCGWGMGEAIIDLKDLLEGKSIPFYKFKGDWKLDMGIPLADSPKSDPKLSLNYHDYLRVFLLLIDKDKKIDKVEDLIELNNRKVQESFKMGECYSYIKIEAEISMNYLFMTQPFIPKSRKTEEGRHNFKVVLYEEY